MPKINAKSGFSLLEVMMVVVIISIGAATAYFSIRGTMPDARLSAAARDLKSDLSLARLRAVRENRNVLIQFNDSAGTYTIFVDGDADFTESAGEAIKTVAMPEGIELNSMFPGDIAVLDMRGLLRGVAMAAIPVSPYNCVYLSNSKNNSRRIDLAITGKATLLASNDGATEFAPLP